MSLVWKSSHKGRCNLRHSHIFCSTLPHFSNSERRFSFSKGFVPYGLPTAPPPIRALACSHSAERPA